MRTVMWIAPHPSAYRVSRRPVALRRVAWRRILAVLLTVLAVAPAGVHLGLPQQVLFSIINLSPGSHTIKLVTGDGTWMLLDGFIVTP